MTLGAGQILQGRYRIVRPLGQGGMGAVYLAEHVRLSRRHYAIKEQVPDPTASPQALVQLRQQFLMEADTLAGLDHPNLAKVSDYFTDGGNEYLVMDYVAGQNLHEVLQQRGGPLPEQPVLLWVDQVLDALEYLHSQQPHPIIHRDVKPSNLILMSSGRVKLVDFGLVKLFDPSNPGTATIMQGMGTPEYTPLEQYTTGPGHTDIRTDIYALGATLYHLLSGMAPPTASQRVISPTTPPRQHNPQLSPATNAAILKAMELHPDNRFQSAREMQVALAGVPQVTTSAQTTQPPPPPPPTQPVSLGPPAGGRRFPRWFVWVGVAVLLLAAVFVGKQWDDASSSASDASLTPRIAVVVATETAPASPSATIIASATSSLTSTPTSVLIPTETLVPPPATATRTPRPSRTASSTPLPPDTPGPPTATSVPTDTSLPPTTTPIPPTETPVPPTATLRLATPPIAPTITARASATSRILPTILPPTVVATVPVVPTISPTSVPTMPPVTAPDLVAPVPNHNCYNSQGCTFRWNYPGTLSDNQYFQVQLAFCDMPTCYWFGAHAPTKEQAVFLGQNTPDVLIPNLQMNCEGSCDMLWVVVVAEWDGLDPSQIGTELSSSDRRPVKF